MDFSGKTGPELVTMYNEMYQTWTDLGGDNTFGTVKRFASAEVGRVRCERLHAAIQEKRGLVGEVTPSAMAAVTQPAAEPATEAEQAGASAPTTEEQAGADAPTTEEETDEMAKKRKAGRKPARQASRAGGRPTIKELTEEFNSLVPGAKRAGVTWAKHHSSAFGSVEAGVTQVARLKKAIASAK